MFLVLIFYVLYMFRTLKVNPEDEPSGSKHVEDIKNYKLK